MDVCMNIYLNFVLQELSKVKPEQKEEIRTTLNLFPIFPLHILQQRIRLTKNIFRFLLACMNT